MCHVFKNLSYTVNAGSRCTTTELKHRLHRKLFLKAVQLYIIVITILYYDVICIQYSIHSSIHFKLYKVFKHIVSTQSVKLEIHRLYKL